MHLPPYKLTIGLFQKPQKTKYPPQHHSILIWDGACGFCAYWTQRIQEKLETTVVFEPYQTASKQFEDINEQAFKEASHLVETNGVFYSGPRSFYRLLKVGNSKWSFLDSWYAKKPWFKNLSDGGYQWVAKHRNFCFKLTKFLFGSDPKNVKPFWVIYLAITLYLLYVLLKGN